MNLIKAFTCYLTSFCLLVVGLPRFEFQPNKPIINYSAASAVEPVDCSQLTGEDKQTCIEAGLAQNEGCSQFSGEERESCLRQDTVNLETDGINPDELSSDYITEFWVEMAVFISIVVAGAGFYLSCVTQISAIVFGVGGVSYLIAEIINWSNYSNQQNVNEQALETKKHQTEEEFAATEETLQFVIDDLENAKSGATARQVFIGISAVAWLAAAVIAFLEAAKEILSLGIVPSWCSLPTTNAPVVVDNNPSQVLVKNLSSQYLKMLNDPEYLAFLGVNSSLLHKKESQNQEFHSSPDNLISLKSLKQKLANLVVSDVIANDALSSMGIIGVYLLFVLGLVSIATATTQTARTNGIVRGIIFIVFAILGIANIVSIGFRKAAIDERIQKFEELKSSVVRIRAPNPTNDPSGVNNNADSTHDGGGATPPSGNDGLPPDAFVDQCASFDAQSVVNTARSTSCSTQTGSFDPIIDESSFSGGGINFDPGSMSTFNTTRDGLNSLAKGKGLNKDFAANGSAGALARGKRNVRDASRQLLKMLKENKIDAPNMQDEYKKITDNLKKGIDGEIAKLSATDLQNLRTSLGDGMLDKATEEGSKSDDHFQKMLKSLDKPLADMGLKKPAFKGFSFGDNDPKTEPSAMVDSAQALNKYKFKTEDILKDSSVPIWTVISVRYRKSAYPAFFDKKAKGESLDSPDATEAKPNTK